MCKLVDCPYDHYNENQGYCKQHHNRFEDTDHNDNVLGRDWLFVCERGDCTRPVIHSGCVCSEHGGFTSTHKLLETAERILKPLKDFFDNSESESDDLICRLLCLKYQKDPNFTFDDYIKDVIQLIVDLDDQQKLKTLAEDLNIKLTISNTSNKSTTSDKGATMSNMLNADKLKTNGKKMLVRKAARKLLNSRKNVVKLLTKANIVKEETGVYLQGILESELGEMAWGFVVTALATYLPQIHVAEKYKGLQEQLVDELQIQTMDTGSDKIIDLATMLFENLFSDEEKTEDSVESPAVAQEATKATQAKRGTRQTRKPAALPAESVQKAEKIDLSSLSEEVVTVGSRSRKSNR